MRIRRNASSAGRGISKVGIRISGRESIGNMSMIYSPLEVLSRGLRDRTGHLALRMGEEPKDPALARRNSQYPSVPSVHRVY